MDIFRFINSKDLREHLRAIDYHFSAAEAAYLVWQSLTATLPEKQLAYEEILRTMPDEELPDAFGGYHGSLHVYLQSYLEIENRLLRAFKQSGDGMYQAFERREFPKIVKLSPHFPTFESCIDYMVDSYKNEELHDVYIEKEYIGEGPGEWKEKTLRMNFNANFHPMSINWPGAAFLTDEECRIFCYFEDFRIDLPTPFQKGDILHCVSDNEKGPLVLTDLCTWIAHGAAPADYSDALYYTDLLAYGLVQEPGGAVCRWRYDYLNCEFYRGSFDGSGRFLKALSAFVKGQITDVSLLLNAYRVALREEDLKESKQRLYYPREDLALAGLLEEDEGS